MALMVECKECEGRGAWPAKSHKAWCLETFGEGECDCPAGETQMIPCENCGGRGWVVQADVVHVPG